MAKDPVCNMTVDETKSLTAEHGGETYHFCAQGCKDRFVADPGKYTGGGAQPHHHG